MRRPVLALILLLIALLVAIRFNPPHDQDVPRETKLVSASGEFEFSVSMGDENRPYILYVPSTYEAGTQIPLVLFFHGGGGDMRQARSYNFEDTAEKYGFAVAFLNGASAFPNGRLATWNAGTCCGRARDTESDDVGYVRAVVADIQAQFAIADNKIFATGMSNGAMMSYRLACEASDIFAAIAPVAGTDSTTVCNPANPVSVLHIHALDDTHVLFEGGAGEDAFNDLSRVTEFTSVADSVSLWLSHNDITSPMTRILDVDGAYCDARERQDGEAAVTLCVTETGGHSWPGSDVGTDFRNKTPSQAIDANEVIWEFFNTHHR